jgi:hypothetical protein
MRRIATVPARETESHRRIAPTASSIGVEVAEPLAAERDDLERKGDGPSRLLRARDVRMKDRRVDRSTAENAP